MRITRLALRNFRVYEDHLELELPGGLVGIFGPNGAGKSTLLEAILFTLFGRARTGNDEIRTSGVAAECVTELEFEHEGHLYVVRRTISGTSNTVKATAHCDGAHVAEGVKDTGRYVRSVLGMDDAAFRASVFAEQKQVAAFSAKAPAERRKLVLQLLGITPLDGAAGAARRDARTTRDAHEQARRALDDLDELAARVEAATAAAAAATEAARAATAREAEAAAAEDAARAALDELVARRGVHEQLVQAGRAARTRIDDAAARAEALERELLELEGVDAELDRLRPVAEGLDALQRRHALVAAAEEAAARLAAAPEPTPVEEPDEAAAAVARAVADAAAKEAAELDGLHRAALDAHRRAAEAAARAGDLSGEADCPMCGQALGDAFEQVRAHRAAEVDAAAAEVARLASARLDAHDRATAARATAKAAEDEVAGARRRRGEFERLDAQRESLVRAAAERAAACDPPAAPGEGARLAVDVETARAAADRARELGGRLARRSAAAADLATVRGALAEAGAERDRLLVEVKALAFDPAALEAAATTHRGAADAAGAAREASRSADRAAATATAAAEAATQALVAARERHDRIAHLADEARHLGRAAELLGSFRNDLVGQVGPRLSRQAAALFGELTDREYDELRVDPESYEVRIVDQGREYGMDRFSGSETDLANLALRVAISEHVRFQSGGQVGLLVLDEVFGPLDQDRKERMLVALERLRAHFRQVLVVTHDREIKEQLPSAVEVVKLPGRRATARLVG